MNRELPIEWDENKNEALMRERRICFQDVLEAIEGGRILEDSRHPNREQNTIIRGCWWWKSADMPALFLMYGRKTDCSSRPSIEAGFIRNAI
uniref:Uncharacterized protein n=1 Tax=Candidatus Kentrum sp. TC TaxID=2126339 RepID=A0A450Y9F2_9GAMM|nr:MAG: hypothetical protein BECKTC1821D_GA0114238_1003101 [Candidatus Kentron sp. TC]